MLLYEHGTNTDIFMWITPAGVAGAHDMKQAAFFQSVSNYTAENDMTETVDLQEKAVPGACAHIHQQMLISDHC